MPAYASKHMPSICELMLPYLTVTKVSLKTGMLSNDGTHSDSTCMNLLVAVPVTMIPTGFFIMGSGILVVGSWVGWDLDYYTICVAGS